MSTLVSIRTAAAIALLSLFCAGCPNKPSGPQGCADFETAYISKLADECMVASRAELHSRFYEGLMMEGGVDNCSEIARLRDADSLYGDCIPKIQAATCEDIFSGFFVLPYSCEGQLLYEVD